MRIAALGRTRMLYDSIKLLDQNSHAIVLIGTCREAPEYDIKASDFEALARELQAPFFNDVKINSFEVRNILRKCNADIAISVNWRTVIGKEAIESFPYGILNAHIGDLPRFRGNATPNWALIAGEQKIALTIHQMEPDELDSGSIAVKDYYPVDLNTRIGDIYDYTTKTMPQLFLRAVEGLRNGTIRPIAQNTDPCAALRCYPRMPPDSLIRWESSAQDIVRLINASSEPFSGAYTFLNMEKMVVWRAYIQSFKTPSLYIPGQIVFIDKDTGNIGVAAIDGIVVLQVIQMENGSRIQPSAVIQSMRTRLGMNIEDELHKLYMRLNSSIGEK